MNEDLKTVCIRTGPNEKIRRRIPEITLKTTPAEFPYMWFRDHPNSKPTIHLPKISDDSDYQLATRLGTAWSIDHDINPSLEFLASFAENRFRERLNSDWISYGVLIGKKGEEITPLNLVNVDLFPYAPSEVIGLPLQPEGELERFASIVAIYRAHNAKYPSEDHKMEVLTKMENSFKKPPFNIKSLDVDAILSKVSWAANDSFKKLIACIDMFFNYFHDSEFAKIRFATMTSRNKGCGGLRAIEDLSKYIGEPTHIALSYAMDSRIGEELVRLTEDADEVCNSNSYFHYMRDLGLSNKSPYSSSMNPNIYNFTYSVGTFLGIKRACDARLFSDAGFTKTMNLAAYVAFYIKRWIDATVVVGEEDTDTKAKITDDVEKCAEEDEANKKNNRFILNQILFNKGEVSEDIRITLRERLSCLKNLRQGTIGKQIQDTF